MHTVYEYCIPNPDTAGPKWESPEVIWLSSPTHARLCAFGGSRDSSVRTPFSPCTRTPLHVGHAGLQPYHCVPPPCLARCSVKRERSRHSFVLHLAPPFYHCFALCASRSITLDCVAQKCHIRHTPGNAGGHMYSKIFSPWKPICIHGLSTCIHALLRR